MASEGSIRLLLRILPSFLRERLAARLFLRTFNRAEPDREAAWRAKGEPVELFGCRAVAFGTGPQVALLMHGWEGRGLQLSAYIDALCNEGLRVLAIDGPGHGKSEGVGGIPSFAHLLTQCMETMDVRIVVAHSMGAAASLTAATRTGFEGRLLCLAGPPDPSVMLQRARAYMGLPGKTNDLFMRRLKAPYRHFPMDEFERFESSLTGCRAQVLGILVQGDDHIPEQESQQLIEAAGGHVLLVNGPTHRNVMWNSEAVATGLAFCAPISA